MKIEFEDGEIIHLNVPLAFTSEKPWQTLLEDSLVLAMARRIQELEAEKEAFYMDYRTQCDKDTKILEERIAILSRQLVEKETQRHILWQHVNDKIKQCDTIPKENESLNFLNLCALLPESVCWGDTLTPSLVREILMAYRSERYKDEQRG